MLKDQIKTIINSCATSFVSLRFLVPDIEPFEVTDQVEHYEPALIRRRKISKKSRILGLWVVTGLFITNITALIHSGSMLLSDQYVVKYLFLIKFH